MFLPVPCQLLTKCNQNPYWSLSLYIFRLQAVIFPYFFTYLFIFICLQFSSDGMPDEKKKKRHRRPYKGPTKQRTVGSSHWNTDVNKWKEHMMKRCIEEYYTKLAANNNIAAAVNRAKIVIKYGISPLTLHHRVSKSKSSRQVPRYKHASGGKRQPCKFSVGKCTSSYATSVSRKIKLTSTTSNSTSTCISSWRRWHGRNYNRLSKCWVPTDNIQTSQLSLSICQN